MRIDDFDNGEDGGEIRSFYFSNPDHYAKVEPRPDDAPSESFLSMTRQHRSEKSVRLLVPDVKIVEEHGARNTR